MKNLKLFIFSMVTFLLYTVGLQAQVDRTITRGDVKNYSVDTADGPNGTDGSTYTWSVYNVENPTVEILSGTTLTITNRTASGNAITIDWGTTPTGIYTLKVIESTESCQGDEKLVRIEILPRITLEAPTVEVCSNGEAVFRITDAEPESIIEFTVIGGTSVEGSSVTIDADGNATITVTPTAGSTEISVTLVSMTIDGEVRPIDPAITQSVDVTIITTSEIEFED